MNKTGTREVAYTTIKQQPQKQNKKNNFNK